MLIQYDSELTENIILVLLSRSITNISQDCKYSSTAEVQTSEGLKLV